jgi:hypothetical protein
LVIDRVSPVVLREVPDYMETVILVVDQELIAIGDAAF